MDVTLPFELVAVEAALASCAKNLEMEAADLEHRAEPSLVRLSQKVSRKELENVKNYKAALNRLIVRVSKVKTVCLLLMSACAYAYEHTCVRACACACVCAIAPVDVCGNHQARKAFLAVHTARQVFSLACKGT